MNSDLEKYRPYLADYDLSTVEQDELIRAMHAIAEGFVDRAFGHDPVQLALTDGQSKRAFDVPGMIDLSEVADSVFADTTTIPKGREET